ncbi:MAG: MBL fold metallo-hydrolase [Desulfurococcales archaeon]|nr:MBL fold metallo-hydrolase [Desulfurococcales archaeon]
MTVIKGLELPLNEPVNSYVIHDLQIMVDAGIDPPDDGYEYVYITHWHWDHVMGISKMRGKTICMGPTTYDVLSNKKFAERFYTVLRAGGARLSEGERAFISEMESRYKKALEGLKHNNVYVLDECPHVETGEVKVLECPGHSIDHVCYIIGDYIFTGDTILPSKRTTIIDFRAHRESVVRVLARDWHMMYPGHGDPLNRYAAEEVAEAYVVGRCSRAYRILRELAHSGGELGLDQLLKAIYGVEPSLASFVAVRTLIGYIKELEDEGVVSVDRSVSPWKVRLL